MNPSKKTSESVFFLSCLLYSLANCAICSWAYILTIKYFADNNIAIYWIVMLVITLIGSIVLSVIIGQVKQRRLVNKLADLLGIKLIDPTPTAWDYWFSKRDASLMLVTLVDGSEVRGWFGNESFASSDLDERDIFIEKVYLKLIGNEQWIANPENNGIYISKNLIKHIEFFSVKNEEVINYETDKRK